jgi:hypothetical protein
MDMCMEDDVDALDGVDWTGMWIWNGTVMIMRTKMKRSKIKRRKTSRKWSRRMRMRRWIRMRMMAKNHGRLARERW